MLFRARRGRHRCYVEPGAGGGTCMRVRCSSRSRCWSARCRRTCSPRTSAPGLGPPRPTSAQGLGSPRPTSALGQWDWAHPAHVGARTGLTQPTSAPGFGSPRPTSAPGLGSLLAHLRRDCMGSPRPTSAAGGAGAGRLRLARGLGGLLADGEDLHKAAAPRKGAEGTLRCSAVLDSARRGCGRSAHVVNAVCATASGSAAHSAAWPSSACRTPLLKADCTPQRGACSRALLGGRERGLLLPHKYPRHYMPSRRCRPLCVCGYAPTDGACACVYGGGGLP
jgi:hypothetical protein